MKKKKVTQKDVAEKCHLDQSSVSKILAGKNLDLFSKETIKKVIDKAREIGYLHPRFFKSDRRLSERKKVNFPAKLQIIIGLNTVYDTGTAQVCEISQTGMLLRDIKTEKNSLPLDRVRIDLEITDGALSGEIFKTRIARFPETPDEFTIAVRFEGIPSSLQKKLRQIIRNPQSTIRNPQ